MTWRARLLLAIGVVFVVGEAWMWGVATEALRNSIAVLTAVYLAAMAGVFVHYRHRITPNLLSANAGLGAIVHLALFAVIVATERLTVLGILPALASNWHHFLLGALGILAAFVSWTRARATSEPEVAPAPTAHEEPAPPPPSLPEPPAWSAWSNRIGDDARRQRELARLRRLENLLTGEDEDRARIDNALRALRQEAERVVVDGEAEAQKDDDVLSQAANLLEWGAQKLPELAELDVSDLLMAKAIADIRSKHDRIEQRFVDHRLLRAIHPIDRATADTKCDERAAAARAALPVLEANGMRLSEDLIATNDALAAFRSVTGFQVVELTDGGFVTFEGNGRREALARAFGDTAPVHVEVRAYLFDDPTTLATIRRRVERVRTWKNVTD